MFKTFKASFAMTNATKKNQFLYWLKSLPLIRDFISNKLYKSKIIRFLTNIYTYISEFFSTFAYKILYYTLIALFVKEVIEVKKELVIPTIFHTIICLGLCGMFFNNAAVEAKEDTYFGIFLMRLNAKKYMISNYMYFLIKYFVGTLVVSLLLLGCLLKVSLVLVIAVPIYGLFIKVLCSALYLKYTDKNLYNPKRLVNYQGLQVIVAVISLTATMVGLITGLTLPVNTLPILCILLFIPFIMSVVYLFRFDNYKYVYKMILSQETFVAKNATDASVATYNTYLEEGKGDKKKAVEAHSDKEGFEYFNDIFTQRHKKLLIKPVVICAAILAVVFIVASIVIVLTNDKEIYKDVNEALMNNLPVVMFIMYFINRGESITRALYINCDSAMLHYKFYRRPEALKEVFNLRLKTISLLNMIPTMVIAIGLQVLLFITGEKHIYNYLIIFIGVIAMNMIFSIHYLFLYYILQPFNENMQMKSGAYGIMVYVTYMVCYMFVTKKLPSLIFCSVLIGLCIVYYIFALILVYNKGTKTFKVRN